MSRARIMFPRYQDQEPNTEVVCHGNWLRGVSFSEAMEGVSGRHSPRGNSGKARTVVQVVQGWLARRNSDDRCDLSGLFTAEV